MTPGADKRLRLRWEAGGVEGRHSLKPGETRIGSAADNDVVLSMRGISRRHALLQLHEGALTVQDLESRNGVQVNGARTLSARLEPGDELRLGPILLRLEQVDVDDDDLAIDLVGASPRAGRNGAPPGATELVAIGHGIPAGWMRIVEGFAERLSGEAGAPAAAALVARELPARGCCFLVVGEASLAVVAAAGEIAEASALEITASKARFGSSSDPAGGATTWISTSPPATVRAIAISGDFPGRSESEPLLRALLGIWRLVDPDAERVVHRELDVDARQLVLPDGWVEGTSASMASLADQMRALAGGDLPVLIIGETGTGKELVARTLHASSTRGPGPFVAVNCAAIPADLLEAEMFGIVKGAATGVTERPGKFRLAHEGTLFLDEIGDMSLDLQAKLLRALQEKEVQPVGSSAPVAVDIRVLAATNSDLGSRIENGRFRRDLYHRLAGYRLVVPPLRDRRGDVPALVTSFLRSFAAEAGKEIRGMTPRALRALVEYSWPGNVRELELEVRRLVYLCPAGGTIDAALLAADVLAARPSSASTDEGASTGSLDLGENVRRLEAKLIREALARADGNQTSAAKLLGISRNGLANKMKSLGLSG